jgi:transcriptional regulator with XRE-family HTH domain
MPPKTATRTTVEINGYALREIRVRSGVSVQDVADAIGCNRSYVARMETGHTHRVSPAVFEGLTRALTITDKRALMAFPHVVVELEGIPA